MKVTAVFCVKFQTTDIINKSSDCHLRACKCVNCTMLVWPAQTAQTNIFFHPIINFIDAFNMYYRQTRRVQSIMQKKQNKKKL